MKFKIFKLLVLFLLVFSVQNMFAVKRYWVVFADKDGVTYNPYTYLDAKALERRLVRGISLYEEENLPLKEDYVEAVQFFTGKIHARSRWFNAVSIEASSETLQKIKSLSFVKNLLPIKAYAHPNKVFERTSSPLSEEEENLLEMQIHTMQGEAFRNAGIDGKGVRIAVFDAGFPGVDTHPAYAHLFKNNQIIATHDFFTNKDNVYHKNSHGSAVLACIAGKYESRNIGLATGAEFLLARTESALTEFHNEEENWLQALEWADRHGADIISSSLGYTYQRYFVTDMNGQTSLVSRAAKKASDLGILVINAMGNEGDGKWQVLGTPADAETVMSVGGIDPDTDLHIKFSSFGPTADFRRKPNVSAYGKVVTSNGKKFTTSYGTSFSTPLVAGFAACVWQMKPHLSANEIFELVEQSGSLFPYYDYAHGYGIPQATFFTAMIPEDSVIPSFTINTDDDRIIVQLTDEYLQSERKGLNRYLFYHIEQNNRLLYYAVLNTFQKEVLTLDLSDIDDDAIIRIHCNNYTKTIQNN